MWKDYSGSYIKNNRSFRISIFSASFIAALFLALLCSLFYNFWLDSIEGTRLEDGDWHGRITGEINGTQLAEINQFANVEKAVINEELTEEENIVVDVYFYNKRTIYEDMQKLVSVMGLTENAADYNYQLLSMYFIRIPGDKMPRLLMPAYMAIVALVCVSLILVIHNSFAVTMDNRIHQFGILSSIGVTPGQILTCLLQEAFMLSIVPILSGILTGIALSFGILRVMGAFAVKLAGGRQISFSCHPAVLAVIFLLAAATVLVSAWIPAGKLSRLTPLEAIRGTGELQLRKKKGIPVRKHSPILSALFGMEGELAGNACRAQKKALRTTSLSLTLALLGFMLMQCFFTLSGISTNHTYFEKYQDVWDVMITIKDSRIEEFGEIGELQNISGLRSSAVYQKAEAVSPVPVEDISAELCKLGGLEAVAGSSVSVDKDVFWVKAPVVILDDKSFGEYCAQIGITPGLGGAIVLNRIWDSKNSNFRYREYIPYIAENRSSVTLQSTGQNGSRTAVQTKIPVLAYAKEAPVLREEYDDYALVNVIPLSLWKETEGRLGAAKEDICICLLAKEGVTLEQLDAMEEEAVQLIGTDYEMESENRIREKITNDEMIKGYETILGGFCVLFAIIGIAHVFSNTLGFLRQRKREFARYMSVGMTPAGMGKIFCIEALVIAGRPVITALVFTTAAVAVMIKASYLEPAEFIKAAPVVPVLLFIFAVFGFIALAYYLGARKLLGSSLAEALKDDRMA